MRETKRSQVIKALMNGDYVQALKIAKTFNIELTKEENTIVRRAYEMQWNPGFYEQLGFNKDEEFKKAINILTQKYLNVNEKVQI